MKIIIKQNKLKEGLNIVGRTSSLKSTTLPILKNIFFKVENNFLNMVSTDLELGIKWWSLVKGEKKKETTIPYSSFFNFINLLPDKDINLNIKDNNITIECDDYKTQIHTVSAKDFPVIPEIKEKGKVIINSDTLCEGLSQIIDIPSLSKVKPEISGVFISINKKEIKLVATDSYRLAEKIIYTKKDNQNLFSFIIPQKTAREVINILKDINKEIEIIFSDNQILFKVKMDKSSHSYIELTSKIIEGNYPNYESIIPKECSTQMVLSRDEFINKIKAASVFTGRINEVNLEINPNIGEMIIKSNNTDLGEYEAKIKGKAEGDSIKASFNYRFLLDGLSNIKSSEIIFESNGEKDPGVIKPVGKTDFLYIVMPIKN